MIRIALTACLLLTAIAGFGPTEAQSAKIHIAFLWHMHQPIYWPGETIVQTDANNRYDYSVTDIHLSRTGPYTSWPWNAVQKGITAGMGHFGAQVSFSGSLMENLDHLASSGQSSFSNWDTAYSTGATALTTLGNPRLDMVGFGYHHPLMALIEPDDVGRQIALHRVASLAHFGGATSKGIFPPENSFTRSMIPALVDQGIAWVLVDNVHFDRAADGYPYNSGSNLTEPNSSDVRNVDPADWIALNGLWAPTPVSGGWGHRPHWVEHVDPVTSALSRVVAVPADRYMGNEDGRGGFGALNYDAVISQLEPYNTDPDHPLLVVLHHDGDNYGGGTDSYYDHNFQNFVNWLAANPSRFECTTIEDYLERFPPAASDVIHVEPGSWSGADNGDPEFKKWMGDVDGSGYSPDQNSWAVLTAARNHLRQAELVAPGNPAVLAAEGHLLNAQASDYWYWDWSQEGRWDSHPTRAANLALGALGSLLTGAADFAPPDVLALQREPYNPGGEEWGVAQPSDFEVWTFAYDVAGLASVTLYVREDDDGVIAPSSVVNETYAGGAGVGTWVALPMTGAAIPLAQTNPAPMARAARYSVAVTGYTDTLLDYYVEAIDTSGNVRRSEIAHVYVGAGSGGGNTGYVMDGAVDASANEVSSGGPVSLYLDFDGTNLYMATEAAAGVAEDVFLMVAENPGDLQAAMWAKAGSVAGWSAFVGNESTNAWSGWFDQTATAEVFAGSMLEATLDLVGELGWIPPDIYVAVLRYSTSDGGALLGQFPAGNADGNVDASEYFPYALRTTAAPPAERRGVRILSARPNPFNPHTAVRFEVPVATLVRLEIFDGRGRRVREFAPELHEAGEHEVVWDGTDTAGRTLASGVYFVRAWSGDSERPSGARKLTLIR